MGGPRHPLGDRFHVVFIGTSLGFALFGGLLLAVILPVDAALRGTIGSEWLAAAQVHGHLQTIGFVGLFVMGMAYRLLPGFSGAQHLRYPTLVFPSFWLVAGGVLARALGQLGSGRAPLEVLMVTGAWAELLGTACFAVNIVALAWPAARKGRPFALFFLAGTTWLVVQAALGAVWLTQLGIERGSVLGGGRDTVLTTLQLFGFHLMFILGVAVRSFPIFFAARHPTVRGVLPAWGAGQLGIGMLTAVALVQMMTDRSLWAIEDVATALLGAGLLGATFLTGWWRPPTRIRPASRPFAYTLQPAMAWLVIAGAMLIGFAARGYAQQTTPAFTEMDATRHVVAIGVVLMTIVGMAQLVLPEFASERLVGRQGAWRGAAFGIALSVATVARVGPRFVTAQLPGELGYWLMAAAGIVALLVVGLLGFYYRRGVRDYRATIATAAARLERPGPPREDW